MKNKSTIDLIHQYEKEITKAEIKILLSDSPKERKKYEERKAYYDDLLIGLFLEGWRAAIRDNIHYYNGEKIEVR